MKDGGPVSFFCMRLSRFLSIILKRLFFLHGVCWLLLCKLIDHGLFLNSVQLIYNSLLLCPYCTVLSYSLYYSLRPRGVLPPLLFFLKIALVLKDFLLFRIDFRIFFFLFYEKCDWNFDDCIESVDCSELYGHFNSILPIHEHKWKEYLSICIFFNFFHQCLLPFSLF